MFLPLAVVVSPSPPQALCDSQPGACYNVLVHLYSFSGSFTYAHVPIQTGGGPVTYTPHVRLCAAPLATVHVLVQPGAFDPGPCPPTGPVQRGDMLQVLLQYKVSKLCAR